MTTNYNIIHKKNRQLKEKHLIIKKVKYNKHKHNKSSWITRLYKMYQISRRAIQKIQKNYLNNRKQFVDLNNTVSTTANISTGVPQGSILCPLCLLYI